MQPTFLPWLGYFAMIDAVDTFVYLDSVQFARRSWQQRNKIKTPIGEAWISLSIQKGPRDQKIAETVYDIQSALKISRLIEQNYQQASYFASYWPQLRNVLLAPHPTLSSLNINLIEHLVDVLDLHRPETHRSSDLKTSGAKATLLANICTDLGHTSYLSAPGSREYIEESGAFGAQGVSVHYHHYQHPRYEQLHGDFIEYMSVIDLLFNVGPRSNEVIRAGMRRSQ